MTSQFTDKQPEEILENIVAYIMTLPNRREVLNEFISFMIDFRGKADIYPLKDGDADGNKYLCININKKTKVATQFLC